MKHIYFSRLLFCILLFPLVLLAKNANDSIVVIIKPHFNHQKITKKTWFLSSNKDSIQLKKIRFYTTSFHINGIKILNSNFLVDVFDQATTKIVLPKTTKETLKTISFNIGVEEKMNTSGALSGDLDPSKGMYWSWQSGYINFKVEGVSPNCNTRKNKFQFHLGGYKIPYKTTRKVDYKLNNEERIIIDLNIGLFFNEISLKNNNQIMIPGEEASLLADMLPKLFSIKSE